MKKTIRILGIRGIPAAHGGFETFAEYLSLYLVEQGWRVIVYCQEQGSENIRRDTWKGVERVHISVDGAGPKSTIRFDWLAVRDAVQSRDLCLMLGYNTAIFLGVLRAKGIRTVINMDGIEWRRDKWSALAKIWFWLNEKIGCYLGNHLVADNPAIEDHLAKCVSRKKITMIPYGATEVNEAEEQVLAWSGLKADGYSIIVARPEPENSFLEMISAFSQRTRSHILVVLGKFEPETNPYHRRVMESASSEVVFLGAIYESHIIRALRYFARFYLHGHTVGGTNPSLVEAMGAGCAVIAHDNIFNRWVTGTSAEFFKTESDCAKLFDQLLSDRSRQQLMKRESLERFRERFRWARVLAEYEKLLLEWSEAV
jgi:glycosyltransferase involved in cell wall biosynthesis